LSGGPSFFFFNQQLDHQARKHKCPVCFLSRMLNELQSSCFTKIEFKNCCPIFLFFMIKQNKLGKIEMGIQVVLNGGNKLKRLRPRDSEFVNVWG
jgi:hypothetical protein